MAATLARQIQLASGLTGLGSLFRDDESPEGALWPRPHNALFDFEATTEGAAWIDAFARRARSVRPRTAGRMVVGHVDWSVKHFRFAGEEVRVVYDWDSLRLAREPIFVGSAAATFTATWYLDVGSKAPDPDELVLFVEEYEEARGSAFSKAERLSAFASAVYATAYCARCEHAIDPGGEDPDAGSFRETLSARPDDYLRLCSPYKEQTILSSRSLCLSSPYSCLYPVIPAKAGIRDAAGTPHVRLATDEA
jgi:hypothetical protein